MLDTDRPISEELAFLTEHTGEDEAAVLAHALQLGLDLLYRETAERAFINGKISADDAARVLGDERVRDIEYAKEALAQDVARGLGL
jgi:hypothetical protein